MDCVEVQKVKWTEEEKEEIKMSLDLDRYAKNIQMDNQQLSRAKNRRNYYQRNRDKIAERNRAYYEANRDKIAERWRSYREQNKEKISESSRRYYQKNREKILERNKKSRHERKAKNAEIEMNRLCGNNENI